MVAALVVDSKSNFIIVQILVYMSMMKYICNVFNRHKRNFHRHRSNRKLNRVSHHPFTRMYLE